MGKLKEYFENAEKGDSLAQYIVGHCFLVGCGVEPNEGKTFEWFMKSALNGDPQGQCGVGYCYNCGVGVQQNNKEAIRWFELSSKQGLSKAFFNLGHMYYNCEGIETDIKKAKFYFSQAASHGNADAMFQLGTIHESVGLMHDSEIALRWFKKGADLGSIDAQIFLYCYYKVTKEYDKSFKYIQKAAIMGDASAQFLLAMYYSSEQSIISQDYSRAFRWLYIAERGGETKAIDMLIDFYYNGKGVKRDLNKALQMSYKNLRVYGPNSRNYNDIAFLLLEKGDNLKSAKKASEKALAYDPLDPNNHDTKGSILLKEGNVDEALTEFKYCLSIDDRRSIFHEHIGDAYIVKKMYEQALNHFSSALVFAEFDFERDALNAKIESIGNEQMHDFTNKVNNCFDSIFTGVLYSYGIKNIEDDLIERDMRSFPYKFYYNSQDVFHCNSLTMNNNEEWIVVIVFFKENGERGEVIEVNINEKINIKDLVMGCEMG